jgi:HEAT repeat protein
MVRRSVVDVVVGVDREALRPLLEQALDDADAWVRWKALRGIAALGMDATRGAVEARAVDPDFRVRLEAARILSNDPRP